MVERFIVVNRHGFENDPLGTEENGSLLSRGGTAEHLLQESGTSTTFKCVPRTTQKIAILKPQVAGLRLSKNNEHGQGAGANVVDGRDSWRVDLGTDALAP